MFILIFLIQGASVSDNIDEWKRRLTMLLRDGKKQELVSREKKDRRDFDDIAALASRMGLYRLVFFFQHLSVSVTSRLSSLLF